MIFRRKIYDEMLDWKKSGENTALLIEGARRIGKSTIVREFVQNEYRSYKFIDFSAERNEVRNLFAGDMNDLNAFFNNLSALAEPRNPLYPHESAIVLDEIEEFPHARGYIDRLVQDGRYDFIETGSLISIKDRVKGIRLPANEYAIKMYPMDFEEFCWALDDKNIVEILSAIRNGYETRKPLKDMHVKADKLFDEYLAVGGMPQAVEAFVESGKDVTNFERVDREKRRILKLYRDDIHKFPSSDVEAVAAVFDNIPGLLSRHEQSTDISGAPFLWLGDSMICNICYKCTNPIVGRASYKDSRYAKCYMGDTGLLLSQTYSEKTTFRDDIYGKVISGSLHTNNGMLYENAVAQALVKSGHKLYYYTNYDDEPMSVSDVDKHRMEIEFFVITGNSSDNYKFSPIEVKSSDYDDTPSLDRVREKFSKFISLSYIIRNKDLYYDRQKKILCIPPYMTFCIGLD